MEGIRSKYPWFGNAKIKASKYCPQCQYPSDLESVKCPCCNTNFRVKTRCNRSRKTRNEQVRYH